MIEGHRTKGVAAFETLWAEKPAEYLKLAAMRFPAPESGDAPNHLQISWKGGDMIRRIIIQSPNKDAPRLAPELKDVTPNNVVAMAPLPAPHSEPRGPVNYLREQAEAERSRPRGFERDWLDVYRGAKE